MHPRPASRKWWPIGAYWVAQSLVLYVGWAAAFLVASLNPSDWLDAATDPDFFVWTGGTISGITILQAIFVLPVRRPQPARSRGWPIRVSLTVAGLAAACLATALVCAVMSAAELAGADLDARNLWAIVPWGTLLVSWLAATPLLIAFSTRTPRESLLARVAARLFLGTIVEAAAIIPVDVMVRRKTNCYCGEGTFWALTLCAGVGAFALGPAIFLPLLARRRKRWYAGRCEACGYDMAGCPQAARCPECGAGWRAA